MFTGLVTDVGRVQAIEARGDLRRLRIACSYPADSIALGAPCLTAVAVGEQDGETWFDVDVGAETLARTTAGAWIVGARLNLERSLRIGDELGGHIVTGHIDGVATILAIETFDAMSRFDIAAPHAVSHLIAEKGSVALDGTSLTVNAVEGDRFSVLLIPHSLAVTTWSDLEVGGTLNLEVDLMARYAARLTEAR